MKDGVEPVCRSSLRRLFNHVVEYRTGSLEMSTGWLNIFGQCAVEDNCMSFAALGMTTMRELRFAVSDEL
jgi:hypothetical protein